MFRSTHRTTVTTKEMVHISKIREDLMTKILETNKRNYEIKNTSTTNENLITRNFQDAKANTIKPCDIQL
jgi:hypothetical protein